MKHFFKKHLVPFLVFSLMGTTGAINGQDSKVSWVRESTDINFDLYGFGRFTGFESDRNTVNPENRIAQLPKSELGVFMRPHLKLSTNSLEISVKPRLNLYQKLSGNDEVDDFDSEFYFQELKATFHLNGNLDAKFGRYVNNIGTSVFIRPSNPFNQNSGQLNPKIEVESMNFAEVNYSFRNSSISLISSFHEGRNSLYEAPFFAFDIKNALKYDYYGPSADLTLLGSYREGGAYFFGLNGRKNVSQSILVWVDAAFENKVERFYPVLGHPTDLIQYNMENGIENEDWFTSTIFGASYTFRNGAALQFEYFYNQKGYTDEQAALAMDIIQEESQYNFDITRDLTSQNLARIVRPGMEYRRKNYFFSQLSQNDVWSQFNYSLRYFYCLDDTSGQITGLLEWYPFSNLELFTVFLKSHGDSNSDFTQLIDYQVMTGAILKF